MLIIILALVFLLKAFLHFFVNYNLYQYTSLNKDNIDKIKQFYKVESFVTNTILFIMMCYNICTTLIACATFSRFYNYIIEISKALYTE